MPIDRFDEVPLRLHKGEILTITGYYGQRDLRGTKYPLRMDFEVLQWPLASCSLRAFAYSFTTQWIEGILLPLQSSEMKWYKLTLHLTNGRCYQIPLVGKYGKAEGPQAPGKMFEVSLIPDQGTKATKTFRIRGVAEAYDLFDRPELSKPTVLHHAHLLEKALVTPINLMAGDGSANEQGGMALRYVKIPEADRRARAKEPKRKVKVSSISFSAAFCVGFH